MDDSLVFHKYIDKCTLRIDLVYAPDYHAIYYALTGIVKVFKNNTEEEIYGFKKIKNYDDAVQHFVDFMDGRVNEY